MNFDLKIHHIKFILEAQTTVHMGAQAGAQVRGALWEALNEVACTAPMQAKNPDHALHCPKCFLMELESYSPRGQNPPRPFAIRPPLGVRAEDDRVFETGEQFELGMTLMGKATGLFPYIVQGLRLVGQQGVGYGRSKGLGHFVIIDIQNYNPHSKACKSLLNGTIVSIPKIAIQRETILDAIEPLSPNQIRLRFLTPTTIKHERQFLTYPEFEPLIARLLERCQALAYHYGQTSGLQADWQPIYQELTQKAAKVKRVHDNTRWIDVRSGSRRSNRYQKIGGFVGDVLFEGDIRPFHEWLLWGQSLQVGKSVVKGNGWYEIVN